MSLLAFLLLTDTAENRTLRRARALGKRVSVFSPRARTPAGGRSRCGFAKQIRGFSAQTISPIWMRCLSNLSPPCPTSVNPPVPRRIELYAGCRRKENALATQAGTRFPNGSPGGKRIPESALRLGRSFRMAPQAEAATRNPSSEWDSFSGWRLKRKLRPGISFETGTRFPTDRPVLLNSKTCALSFAKLGRRKPKRNGRRSS